MNRYTKLALIYSIFFPVFALLICFDNLLWNQAFYKNLTDYIFIQSLVLFLIVLSNIAAPVFLLVGFYKEYNKKIIMKTLQPFFINLGLYLLGFILFMIAIKGFIMRPLIIFSFYISFYIIGISIITTIKNFKKR